MNRKIKDILFQSVEMSAIDWIVDIIIALGSFGFGLLQLTLSVNLLLPNDFTRRMLGITAVSPSIYAIVFTLVICLPLIFRRRFPWVVFVLSTACWVVFENLLDTNSLSTIGPLVALFTVAYERGRFEAFIAGAMLFVATLAIPLSTPTSTLSNLLLLQNTAITVAVTLAGYALNARQRYLEQAQARAEEAYKLSKSESERALQAELTRESEAARRVEEERVRIAREIHDITAHSLSAVSVQATAAQRLIDTDSKAAKDAVENIRDIAKTALADMRSMVGVLRSSSGADNKADQDGSINREPTKGTDSIDSLREYLESAGISCTIDDAGYEFDSIPAHVDVALFGIAREAATNILRHSDASRASITLSSDRDEAYLEVVDNGKGISESATLSSGHGIEGMRERVKVLNGTFDMENAEEGGVRIRVSIPCKLD